MNDTGRPKIISLNLVATMDDGRKGVVVLTAEQQKQLDDLVVGFHMREGYCQPELVKLQPLHEIRWEPTP